jgi:hypothetical protein
MPKHEALWGTKSVTTRGRVYDCGAGKAMCPDACGLERLGCGNPLTMQWASSPVEKCYEINGAVLPNRNI